MSVSFFDQFKPRFRELLTDTSPESIVSALETIVYEQGWNGNGELGEDGLVNLARVRQFADVAKHWVDDGLTPANPAQEPPSPATKPKSDSIFSENFEVNLDGLGVQGEGDSEGEGSVDEASSEDGDMADILAQKVVEFGSGDMPEVGEGNIYADEENAASGTLSAGTPADKAASLWERARNAPTF